MKGLVLAGTVPVETPSSNEINMKLLAIFFAFLALSVAESIEKDEEAIADLEAAAASVELKRTRKETLESAASTYNSYVPPSQRPPKPWGQNVPNVPVHNNYYPNQNSDYNHNQNHNVPVVNIPVPPQNNYVPPVNNNIPPQNDYVPPQNTYVPPQNDYVPPQNDYVPPQNDYYPAPPNHYPAPPQNYPNHYYPPTTKPTWVSTTPSVTIITNEHTVGENGNYKYEYKLSDGTWVFEEGYILYPDTQYENVVKKGWYSYKGADGKFYTVTWWADNSGYHAFGEHLPQPPLPAFKAALDQTARDEEQQAESEKNKPLYTTVKPLPTYTTHQPPTYPQPTYPQPTYPQPTYPQPTYPQPTYPQPTYPHNNYHVNQPHPYATK